MSIRSLWRDVVAGRVAMALVPVAPILLLPIIVVVFILVFPLWITSLAVLGVARGLAWLIDLPFRRPVLEPKVDYAFQWVLTFGGLARKISR